MLIRCGMKLLVELKKWLKKYTMNLKDVSDRLRRFGSGIRRFKQYWERERESRMGGWLLGIYENLMKLYLESGCGDMALRESYYGVVLVGLLRWSSACWGVPRGGGGGCCWCTEVVSGLYEVSLWKSIRWERPFPGIFSMRWGMDLEWSFGMIGGKEIVC